MAWRSIARTCGLTLVVVACGLIASADSVNHAATTSTADIERGSELYQRYCASCHGQLGALPADDRVPSHGPGGHTWGHRDSVLITMVLRGFASSATSPSMPAMRGVLSPEDAAAILSYIETSWTDAEHDARASLFGCERYVVPSC